MLYLYGVDNNTNINDYINKAAALKQPELQEEIMTIAETLKKEGSQQTLRENVLEILELRFQSISYSIKKQLEEINDTTELRRLHRLAVQAESVEAFTQGMQEKC